MGSLTESLIYLFIMTNQLPMKHSCKTAIKIMHLCGISDNNYVFTVLRKKKKKKFFTFHVL